MATIKSEEGGTPYIEGHRIGVHHIVKAWVDEDRSTEEIATEVYPQLTESQVTEALKYAFDRRDEFERMMEEREKIKQEIRQEAVTGSDTLPGEYRKDSHM